MPYMCTCIARKCACVSKGSADDTIQAGGFRIQEITGTFLKPVSNALMMGWDPKVLDGREGCERVEL